MAVISELCYRLLPDREQATTGSPALSKCIPVTGIAVEGLTGFYHQSQSLVPKASGAFYPLAASIGMSVGQDERRLETYHVREYHSIEKLFEPFCLDCPKVSIASNCPLLQSPPE